jgi:tetratricopeptide (TPR) repeat protein
VALRTGRPQDTVTEFDEATRLLDSLPADDMIQRRHRARLYVNLAPALRALGRLDEADRACRKAIELFDALMAKNPFRYDFQHEREAAVINRGLVRLSARDLTGANADLTSAADRLSVLSEKFPYTRQFKAELARAHNALAAVAFENDRAAEAAAMSAKAADGWSALLAQHDIPDYHGELGISLGNQGRAVYKSDPKLAKDLLTRALTELLAGLKGSPNDPAFSDAIQKQSRVLAGLFVWAHDHDGARALADKITESMSDRVRATHRAVALLGACMAAVERQKAPAAESDAYESLAIRLVERVAPADWSALRADPDCAPLFARPAFASAVGR